MQRYKKNNIEWLEFDLLSDIPRLKHAVFLRHGGESQGPYASLNTGFQVGDRHDHVQANFEKIKTELKSSIPLWKNAAWAGSNHGKAIKRVDSTSSGLEADFDGLMTAEPGVTLMIKHADCQAALFYDPKNHVGAAVHSGWRGSVSNIYQEAIKRMQQDFGSNPSDLLVCISPSLGPEDAEFMHYRSELPEEFWHFQVRPTYFDFWSISEFQLQNAGILPHHVEVARLSTCSNPYDFFSYRRDKITGRHATCLTLL